MGRTGYGVHYLQTRGRLRPARKVPGAGVHGLGATQVEVGDRAGQDDGPGDGGREVVEEEVRRGGARRLRGGGLLGGHDGGRFACRWRCGCWDLGLR